MYVLGSHILIIAVQFLENVIRILLDDHTRNSFFDVPVQIGKDRKYCNRV